MSYWNLSSFLLFEKLQIKGFKGWSEREKWLKNGGKHERPKTKKKLENEKGVEERAESRENNK